MNIQDEVRSVLKETGQPFSLTGAQDYLERIEGLKYRLDVFSSASYYVDLKNELERRLSFLEAKLREFEGEVESGKRKELRWRERQEQKRFAIREVWPPS